MTPPITTTSFSAPFPGSSNCSLNNADHDVCEHLSILMAGAVDGTCNMTSGLCMCPPGYSGRDRLYAWNDCHIDDMLKMGLEITALACLALSTILLWAYIVRLLFFWGIISFGNNSTGLDDPFQTAEPTFDRRRSDQTLAVPSGSSSVPTTNTNRTSQLGLMSPPNTVQTSNRRISAIPKFRLSELTSPATNAPTLAHTQNILDRARRRSLLALLSLSIVFCLCGVWFQLTCLISDVRLDQGNVSQYLALSLGIETFICCVWMLLFNWFSRLPSLRMFSTMFPELESKFLFKHPNFIRYMAIVNCLVMFVLTAVFLFAIPIARPDLTYLSGRIFYVLAAVEVVIVAICAQAVSFLLLDIFKILKAGLGDMKQLEARPKEKNRTLEEATVMIKVVLSISFLFGPTALAIVLMMGYWPWARAYYFLFLSIIWIGAAIVVALAGGLLTNLAIKQAARRRKSSLGKDASSNKRSSQSGDGGGGGGGVVNIKV